LSNAGLVNLSVQSSNKFGGDALAKAGMNFFAGVSTARVHGCVGPPAKSQFSDVAYGQARPWVQQEQLLVSSATLPVGTPVSITIRYSVTSVIEKLQVFNPANTSGFSSNTFNLVITGPAQIGRFGNHTATNNWDSISTSGIFSGQSGMTFTETGEITFTRQVGQSFNFSLDLSSTTSAGAISFTMNPAISSGSSAMAATYGVMSIGEGAHLEWNGVPWSGSTDDSSIYIPPNPFVPGPGAVAVFGLLALGGARRRR